MDFPTFQDGMFPKCRHSFLCGTLISPGRGILPLTWTGGYGMMGVLGRFSGPFYFSGQPGAAFEALPKKYCQKLCSPPIAAQPVSCYHVIIPAEYAYSTK